MTLTNQQRADRCQPAITGYSDDDNYILDDVNPR